MPVPFKFSAMPELVAEPVKVSVPVADPDAWGVNATGKETLLPDGIVNGSERPLTENSELLIPAAVIVTGPLLADTAAVWLWLVPTVTLPKFKFAGVTLNCPGVVLAPINAIDSVVFEAFDVITRLPVTVPVD